MCATYLFTRKKTHVCTHKYTRNGILSKRLQKVFPQTTDAHSQMWRAQAQVSDDFASHETRLDRIDLNRLPGLHADGVCV
jgi:hypothetical protein